MSSPGFITAKSLIAYGWGAVFLSSSLVLTAAPLITSLEVGETEVVLIYHDDGTSNDFDLEVNPGLDPANWSPVIGPEITSIGGGKFRFRISRTAADMEFYRVVGRFLSTGLDRDGDGIDNDRETTEFGTDPDKFDTDGDGFSDATEIALGTDPKLASSFPELAHLPAVDFTETVSFIEEGASSHAISLTITPSYTGTVSISVNPRSSAEQGIDYTSIPASVSVSGSSASFSIDIIDDLTIRPDRMLILDLDTAPEGSGYRAAGSVTHIVNISDNDAYWFGTLRDRLTERQFRVRMLKNASTVQAEFVSGQSDGLSMIDGGQSSTSTGVIPDTDFDGITPKESWPATGLVFDLVNPLFAATVADLPSLNNGALTTPLKRTLVFSATPQSAAGHVVLGNYINGTYQEIVTHKDNPNITHLDRTIPGAFTLVREITSGPALNSPLDPTDD